MAFSGHTHFNMFINFGSRLYRQIGIKMGTNCASHVAVVLL